MRVSSNSGVGSSFARRPRADRGEGNVVAWHHVAVAAESDGAAEPTCHSSRIEHVNAELFERFMKDDLGRQTLATALMPLLVFICWPYVGHASLLLWLAVALSVAAMRLVANRIYLHRFNRSESGGRARYVRYFLAVWVARAVVWGASASLFFDRMPIDKQYLCWMVVACAVGFPVTLGALRIAVMYRYLAAAVGTSLLCVFYRLATDSGTTQYELWTIPFAALSCLLLLQVATTTQTNTRIRLELAFDNARLIDYLGKGRDEAEQAVRLKNRFLASAAHDMRQPVLALTMYAEHLLTNPGEQSVVLPKIACAASAVNRLFNSLFDLAKMDNAQATLRIEPIDIAEIMQDLQVQYAPMAEEKSIRLRMRTCRRELMTDPVRARRMIGNLVSNAIKYSPAGSKILMSARARASGVVVEVWDQGIGIPQADLDCVFLEFYKADNAGENSEGFGLGLSIVARLAQALKSRLSVRSVLGRGTVFRLVMNDVNTGADLQISSAVG